MGRIATDIDLPGLAAAVAGRSMQIVPLGDGAHEALAVLARWDNRDQPAAQRIAQLRRHERHLPVMLLTASGDGRAIAEALDAGANDVTPASADPVEIAARLAGLLRATPATLRLGPLSIDRLTRTATRDGRPLNLLPREYALLLHLAHHRGQHVSRLELVHAVWGLAFDPGTNVVQVHISRLRAKLDRGFDRRLLLTDRGRGYRLDIA